MRVHTGAEHGKTRLSFILHSPTGVVAFSHREIKGPLLQRNPDDYQGYLLGKVEKLGARLDVDGSQLLRAEIASKLESLGRDLWRELFPPELRAAYRDVIRPAVHSWVILSDEPWIPWEIVKPYDDSRPAEVLDDDFLCLRFELTRWLAGDRPFVPEIKVRSLAVVQSAPDLPHAQPEREVFSHLKESFSGLSSSMPRLDSAADLLDFLLATDAEVIHLIGHGAPMPEHPDEAGLPFPDKSVLRPADLHGPLATHLGRRRPMVFLNACWAGRKGWSLTRLGGWAARWVGVCGCSAFIAPLWPVRDQAAVSFAWAFYDALAQGAALGEAALRARQKIHRERPGDPSVLAYTVYGHPNAQVLFHDGSSDEEPSSTGKEGQPSRAEWVPKRFRRLPRWVWALCMFLFALALALRFAAGSLNERLFPTEPRPSPLSRPKPPSSPPPPAAHTSTSTTVGGLRFEISGGRSSLQSSLKRALGQAAKGTGISGWTLLLRLDPPQIQSHALDGLEQVSCRLVAHVSAQGANGKIDLGSIPTVNSQFNEAEACEGAAEALAQDVLTQFAASLRKRRES
jgi:hypothetical protein